MGGDPVSVALPEDALAAILRRLPPRSLAASRCVCKAWRAIVDGRRLLLPELLPHSVRGIFLMYNDLDYPAFLSHPSMEPEIFGKLDIHRDPDPYSWNTASVRAHCNGLLLYKDMRGLHVANPATQRRALLPPTPTPTPPFGRRRWGLEHLVFDPTESPHYEVLLVPEDPVTEEVSMELQQQARDETSMEWPASAWVLCVFSSCTGQWEERVFVREGEAAGMASDEVLRRDDEFYQSCSAYWRGVFYVQCNGGLTVMRISLSKNKYRVIKMPTDIGELDYCHVYLGQSKEGLCCASFHDWYKLRVWILNESWGTTEWVLKHHIDIHHSVSRVKMYCDEIEGPWKLQNANSEDYGQQNLQDAKDNEGDSNNALVNSKVEWDSDSDNIFDNDIVQRFSGYIRVLGFHPYKDVIFLDLSLDRAVAYHLNTSVVQDLGKICPDDYCGHEACIQSSFVYTPCLMAEFPENELDGHVED